MYDHVMVFWTLDGLLSTMQEQSLMSECCFVVLCREKKQCIKLTLLFQLRSHFTVNNNQLILQSFSLQTQNTNPNPNPPSAKKNPTQPRGFTNAQGAWFFPENRWRPWSTCWGQSWPLVSRERTPFREKPGEGHQGQSPQNKENLRVPNGWSKQPTTVNRSELVGGIFFLLVTFFGGT